MYVIVGDEEGDSDEDEESTDKDEMGRKFGTAR